MNRLLLGAALALGLVETCLAARCTTVLDPGIMSEYERYVAHVQQAAPGRFDSGELVWVPAQASKEEAAKLESGKLVRWNVSDTALNQRISAQNGTVIHWIGAIRIHGASLADLRSVLEDYPHYDRIYKPMVVACKAEPSGNAPHAYHVILGLQSAFRFASIFPQHYAFRVDARVEDSRPEHPDPSAFGVHLGSTEIRESDSGVPGQDDLLERYHDHGIMWALNAYWRARQRGPDLYLEFESITLARSVEAFSCKLGFFRVPRSIVSSAMDSLPAESVGVILEGTKAECERRAAARGVMHSQ
jgi:hypothetical protein